MTNDQTAVYRDACELLRHLNAEQLLRLRSQLNVLLDQYGQPRSAVLEDSE